MPRTLYSSFTARECESERVAEADDMLDELLIIHEGYLFISAAVMALDIGADMHASLLLIVFCIDASLISDQSPIAPLPLTRVALSPAFDAVAKSQADTSTSRTIYHI